MIMQATRISLAALALGWMSGCQTAGKVTNTAAKPKITQGSSVLAGTAAKNSTPKPLPPGETVSLAIQRKGQNRRIAPTHWYRDFYDAHTCC